MEDATEFEWAVRASELARYRDALAGAGAELEGETRPFTPPPEDAEDYTDAAFEPMLVLVGALAIGHLARVVRDLLHDHGGVLVDVRGGRVSVREHPAIPRDTVLVVGGEDVRRLDGPRRSELVDAIDALR